MGVCTNPLQDPPRSPSSRPNRRTDDGLVQQHVVEHRAQGVLGVGVGGRHLGRARASGAASVHKRCEVRCVYKAPGDWWRARDGPAGYPSRGVDPTHALAGDATEQGRSKPSFKFIQMHDDPRTSTASLMAMPSDPGLSGSLARMARPLSVSGDGLGCTDAPLRGRSGTGGGFKARGLRPRFTSGGCSARWAHGVGACFGGVLADAVGCCRGTSAQHAAVCTRGLAHMPLGTHHAPSPRPTRAASSSSCGAWRHTTPAPATPARGAAGRGAAQRTRVPSERFCAARRLGLRKVGAGPTAEGPRQRRGHCGRTATKQKAATRTPCPAGTSQTAASAPLPGRNKKAES